MLASSPLATGAFWGPRALCIEATMHGDALAPAMGDLLFCMGIIPLYNTSTALSNARSWTMTTMYEVLAAVTHFPTLSNVQPWHS